MMKKLLISSMIVTTIFTSAAQAANLAGDARITRELTAAAVADSIRKNCGSISGNMFVGLNKAMALKKYALGLGASENEIDSFLSSKSEKSRIYDLRDAYLSKNAVTAGDEESYCKLGNSEIARGTLIGSLLNN